VLDAFRMLDGEEAVVKMHLRLVRMLHAYPVNIPLTLYVSAPGCAGAGVFEDFAGARCRWLCHSRCIRSHRRSGVLPYCPEIGEVALGRVVPCSRRARSRVRGRMGTWRLPHSGFCGWFGTVHQFFLALGVVLDDEFHRVEDGHAAGGDFVEVLAHAVFQDREVDHLVGLGDADALGEAAEALGGVAAAARAGEGWACADRPSRLRGHLRRAQLIFLLLNKT